MITIYKSIIIDTFWHTLYFFHPFTEGLFRNIVVNTPIEAILYFHKSIDRLIFAKACGINTIIIMYSELFSRLKAFFVGSG